MSKFSVDYGTLEGKMDQKFYRLSDVKDKIKKVAFDVVRFVDSEDIDGLWQIQRRDDGEYIVATYKPEEVLVTKSSNWKAILDGSGKNVNLFYKNDQVTKIALASVGIPEDEGHLVCNYLPEKLSSNDKMVSGLLKDIPEDYRKNLLAKHPELKK